MPMHPPPGWLILQERARRATSAHELLAVIDEMNALLDEYEYESALRRNPVGASEDFPVAWTPTKS